MMAKGKSFEDMFKRLEEIVRDMEADNLNLEKSLTLFEEGVQLSTQLRSELYAAEQKVTELVQKLEKD